MKVVFDCRYTRPVRHDGISRYSAKLVEELSKLHPVTMLISDPAQLEMLPKLPSVMATAPTSIRELWIARRVNRLKPDVVFTPMQTMGPWGRKYGLVTTVHDLIYYTHRTPPGNLNWAVRLLWRAYHLGWWPQRALLNCSDAHLVDSETTKQLLEQRRMTRRPTHVVLLGTDHDDTPPVRQVPTTRTLVYMGSFMGYKNVDLVVRALAKLPGYRLKLMSKISDHERARLTALAPPRTLEFLNGASDEIYRDALRDATALVMPSKEEGFGLPVVEAQSLGTPVVMSDIPIFREIGGGAGMYFDPNDADDFIATVRSLEDPATWADRSIASLEWSRRFSWAEAAKRLLGVLEQVHRSRN